MCPMSETDNDRVGNSHAASGEGGEGPAAPGPVGAGEREPADSGRTRISAIWVTAIVGIFVLVFLLVFILQNSTTVTVRFLGFSGSLPLGIGLLFSAIAGALLVALLGAARILQLRRRVRRTGRSSRTA